MANLANLSTVILIGTASLVFTASRSAAEHAAVLDQFPGVLQTDDASRAINRMLAEADAKVAANRADCLRSTASDYAREVAVPYDGPRFLSVAEFVDYWSDGRAHPESYSAPMTFDRETGLRVDWQDLLTSLPETAPDEKPVTPSPELRRAFLAAIAPASTDCAGVLESDDITYRLWLDNERDAVAVMPTGMAYIDTPCVDIAYLPAAALEAMNADPSLIDALAATSP